MASKKNEAQDKLDRLVEAATAVLPALDNVPKNDPGSLEAVQELRAAIDNAGGDAEEAAPVDAAPRETVEG